MVLMTLFRVIPDPPNYVIGYGNDDEFIHVAKTLSRPRADQIANLLNANEPIESQRTDYGDDDD
jgi:hypothetical protein